MKLSPAQLDLEKQAHESVMLRLLGALVREQLFPADCHVYQLCQPFMQEVARRFPNQIRLLCIKQNKNECRLYISLQHIGAFQRMKLLAPIWFQSKQEWLRLDRYDQLIELLHQKFGVEISQSLQSELTNHFDFLVYGYQQRAEQHKMLRKKWAKQSVYATTYPEAIIKRKERVPFDEYLYSEALAVEGNPLHPCAKTRIGLSQSERQYLPESCSPIPIHILLIPKKHVHLTSLLTEDLQSFLFRLEPKLKEAAQEACAKKGVSLEEFQLFFVHPWQYQHVIKKKYKHVAADWIVLPISLDSRALLSLRTMDVPQLGLHLKLPVQIQMTNAVRTLSPQATVNGPILSRLCNQLLAEQIGYSKHVVILPELVGAHFQMGKDENDSFLARNLSYTIREHPRRYVHHDELAFVGAALAETTPWGQPLILELIQQAVGKSDVTAKDGMDYLIDFARRFLPPFLYLLQRYGIALEGHMQNVIFVVKQGNVQRLLVRDMGGLRIHRHRFQRALGNVELWDSPILVDKMSEVHNKFFHSVLQNQLGELIFVVADAFQISEQPIWEEVAKIVMETQDPLSPYAKEDQQAFFQSVIQTKALLAMRQENRSAHDYLYIDLPNPLTRGGCNDL